jgi:hypothetical protein
MNDKRLIDGSAERIAALEKKLDIQKEETARWQNMYLRREGTHAQWKPSPTQQVAQGWKLAAKAVPDLLETEENTVFTTFSTGAKRSHRAINFVKFLRIPYLHLIPLESLEELAKRYQLGARKYGDYNWQKGMPYSDTFNHIIEHLYKWLINIPDDDGGNHLAAAAWGCFALIWYERNNRKELDDVHNPTIESASEDRREDLQKQDQETLSNPR